MKSPDIILKAVISYPPTHELVNTMSRITTTLLNHSLPQICNSWFPKDCWDMVDLPTRLQNTTTMNLVSNSTPAILKGHLTTSNTSADVQQDHLRSSLGTEKLAPMKNSSHYARDTTGGPSSSMLNDALAPSAMPKAHPLA
ncbi:hypothetical protein BDR05DRAFT_1000051 [Suillus weaverae]|nr:hypothetical protein BDR05DRAFT_1000051 [Suillus weaverae]